jgi:hypothetical protein
MATDDLIITGYTTRDHLLLDLDDTALSKVARVVGLIMGRWPEVGHCLVLLSSDKPWRIGLKYSWNNSPYMKREGPNYHLVFSGRIGWNKACRICETLAGLRVLQKDYEKIRTFRGDMTLRVSSALLSTGYKAPPTAVCGIKNPRYGGSGDGIKDYMAIFRAANHTPGNTTFIPTSPPRINTKGIMIH